MACDYALEIGGSYARESICEIAKTVDLDPCELMEFIDKHDPATAGAIASAFEIEL